MPWTRRPEAPILSLLRIGLGGLWVYDGLIFKLLALPLGVHAATPGWPALAALLGLDLPPLAQVRLLGAAEVLLGALLLARVQVRAAAAAQCLLLALHVLDVALGNPGALLRPLGPLSRSLVLFSACLSLAAVPATDPARQERRLALLLRAGLGLMWLHEGLVLKWVIAPPVEAPLLAGTGLVPAAAVAGFVRGLGLVEAGLGLAVLLGLAVRRLAVLQVGLLAGTLLLLGAASPEDVARASGGLSRHLAMIGCALVLYQTGGGALALDSWASRSPAGRRLRLLTVLYRAWLLKVAMLQLYRVQAPAADGEVAGALLKVAGDDLHHGEDLLALLQRQGGRRLPVAGLVTALAWLVACLTVIAGMHAALRVDVWAKARALALYAHAARLLPPEEGITARALQAMQGREATHQQILRAAMRPRDHRRR
ncbi:MAG: DoxX-like family protein [Candidatus Methylomirabilales bacterium]